jgi:hypothetical protein
MQKVKARFSFFKRVYCDLGGVPTPYSAGRPVRCELVNASFAEKRSYQELSYAWGKPADGFKQIYIDEHPFQVGINRYEALETLR